jgi:hypothetical protein
VAVSVGMSVAAGSRGWARHFEGWQLGVAVVGVCALSAMLVVPRDVPPELLPVPRVDRLEQLREREHDAERAERARMPARLSLAVRSVGESFRRYGRAAFSGPETLLQRQAQLRRLAAEALGQEGPEPLLELRALQTELWRGALSAGSAEPTSDAVELGGGLLQAARGRDWFAPFPVGADAGAFTALFRLYWARALGLEHQHPFAPTLNEWRAYYRFLLSRPMPDPPLRDGDLRSKLEYVAALVSHDQEYPEALARGILLYWQGSPGPAAAALRTHLERFSDGPWTLRARNHLAACGALLIE